MHHHGHLAHHAHPGYLHAGRPGGGAPYGHAAGPGGLSAIAAANYLAGSLKSGQAAAAAAQAQQQAAFAAANSQGGTLEDRMRWAQMAEAMNQNVYAVSPENVFKKIYRLCSSSFLYFCTHIPTRQNVYSDLLNWDTVKARQNKDR